MSENTITIDLTPETQAGLAAVIPFASTDDVTPVLVAVQITDRRFLTTDRYTVGAFTYRRDAEGEETAAWVIPLDLALWVTKHKIVGGERVILTPKSATIVGLDDTIIASTRSTYGAGNWDISTYNVPPVGRLIPARSDDAVECVPVGISVDRFKQLVKATTPMQKILGKGPLVWRFQLNPSESAIKHAPMLASLGNDDLVVLIQPSLLAR